jgi:hypothetical protein
VPPVPKAQPVSSSLVKPAVPAAAKKAAEFKKRAPIKLAEKSKILPAKKVVNVKKIIETKTPKAAYIPTHKPSPTGYFRGF